MLPTAVLIADYAGTLEVLDRSEARARTTKAFSSASGQTQAQDVTFGVDLFTQPLVRARVTDRHWDYTLGYMPSFTLPDIEGGLSFQSLHVGTASIGWRDRGVRIAVTEEASYGSFNSAYLAQPAQSAPSSQPAQGTTATPQAAASISPILAAPQTIRFASTRTMGSIAVQVGTRTTLGVDGGYLWSGGLDGASQSVIPNQYGPRADASFSYALTRSDQLVTNAYAQDTQFSEALCVTSTGVVDPTASQVCSPEVQIGQIQEGVRHGWSGSTSLEVDGGGAFARTRPDRSAPFQLNVFPSARVAIAHRTGKGGHLALELSAQLSPLIDPRTGVVSNFAQGQMSVTDPLTHIVSFHGALTGAQTVPTDAPLAVTVVNGTVELTFQLDRRVELGVGESAAWQTERSLGTFFFTYGYLAVTVHAPALRF